MQYYVVSDVHAFYDELISSLTEAGYFLDKGEKKLVICGDILDRGPKPIEMVEFISELVKNEEVILVKGNHDDMLMELIDSYEELVEERIVARSHYQKNGTIDTLKILTESTTNEMLSNPTEIIKKLKETAFVKNIYPKMLDYFETDHYIFVHGWLPCREASEYCLEEWEGEKDFHKASEKEWKPARWYSYLKKDDIEDPYKTDKTIVCGHRSAHYGHDMESLLKGDLDEKPDFSPYYGNGFIAIDGGTYVSKHVNCLKIED